MQAVAKVESPVKVKLPAKMCEWKTEHLPVGAISKWRSFFITTFGAYIGTKCSPWDIKDKESLEAMQECWDHIYKSTIAAHHRIVGIHDIVFYLVGILA